MDPLSSKLVSISNCSENDARDKFRLRRHTISMDKVPSPVEANELVDVFRAEEVLRRSGQTLPYPTLIR